MDRKILTRIAIAVGLALFAFYLIRSGLLQQLSFENLKARQADLQDWTRRYHAKAVVLYFLIYVVTTAVSLPGAAVLTLAGGAIFGLGLGTVLVSIASTMGALLAFLVSRFLLRDAIRARFGEKLARIDEGVRAEGAFYLFTLRLIPVFPFFVVNLLMGLTPIRPRTYLWVSQLGMLPATVAYVNAGTQLSQIDSLKGILSPGFILSFVVIGLLPLLSRKLIGFLKAKKAGSRVG